MASNWASPHARAPAAMLRATAGRTLEFHTALSLVNAANGHEQRHTDITRVRMCAP